jgi:hypothetical protein
MLSIFPFQIGMANQWTVSITSHEFILPLTMNLRAMHWPLAAKKASLGHFKESDFALNAN